MDLLFISCKDRDVPLAAREGKLRDVFAPRFDERMKKKNTQKSQWAWAWTWARGVDTWAKKLESLFFSFGDGVGKAWGSLSQKGMGLLHYCFNVDV